MPLNVQKAIEAGYPLSDIANVLAQEARFDIASARQRGYTDEDIVNALANRPQPQTGFMPALRAGFEELKGAGAALGVPLGVQGAEEAAAGYRKKAAEIYRQPEFTEAPVSYLTGLLGQSVPFMLAPVAAGVAGAAAVPAGAGALTASLAAGLSAGLASATQFTGTNIQRQLEEGVAGKDVETAKAVAAALPQAALDTLSLRMVPGLGRIFGRAGIEMTEAELNQVARHGIVSSVTDKVKQYGPNILKTAGTEGLTESAQQVLERAQAGLNIGDEEARKEYFDSFIGGALLGGTLSVPGTAIERGRAREAAEAKRDERLLGERRAEEEKVAAEEAARVASPEYLLGLEPQLETLKAQMKEKRTALGKKPGRGAEPEELEAWQTARDEVKSIDEQIRELQRTIKNRAADIQAAKDEAERQGLTPEQYFIKKMGQEPPPAEAPVAPEEAAPSMVDLAERKEPEAQAAAATDRKQRALDQHIAGLRYFGEAGDPAAVARQLSKDPALAEAFVNGEINISELSKKDARLVKSALPLQLKAREEERAARTAEVVGAEKEALVRIGKNIKSAEDFRNQLDAERYALRNMAQDPSNPVGINEKIDKIIKLLDEKTKPAVETEAGYGAGALKGRRTAGAVERAAREPLLKFNEETGEYEEVKREADAFNLTRETDTELIRLLEKFRLMQQQKGAARDSAAMADLLEEIRLAAEPKRTEVLKDYVNTVPDILRVGFGEKERAKSSYMAEIDRLAGEQEEAFPAALEAIRVNKMFQQKPEAPPLKGTLTTKPKSPQQRLLEEAGRLDAEEKKARGRFTTAVLQEIEANRRADEGPSLTKDEANLIAGRLNTLFENAAREEKNVQTVGDEIKKLNIQLRELSKGIRKQGVYGEMPEAQLNALWGKIKRNIAALEERDAGEVIYAPTGKLDVIKDDVRAIIAQYSDVEKEKKFQRAEPKEFVFGEKLESKKQDRRTVLSRRLEDLLADENVPLTASDRNMLDSAVRMVQEGKGSTELLDMLEEKAYALEVGRGTERTTTPAYTPLPQKQIKGKTFATRYTTEVVPERTTLAAKAMPELDAAIKDQMRLDKDVLSEGRQKELFPEARAEIATERATPANFQRFLQSAEAERLRNKKETQKVLQEEKQQRPNTLRTLNSLTGRINSITAQLNNAVSLVQAAARTARELGKDTEGYRKLQAQIADKLANFAKDKARIQQDYELLNQYRAMRDQSADALVKVYDNLKRQKRAIEEKMDALKQANIETVKAPSQAKITTEVRKATKTGKEYTVTSVEGQEPKWGYAPGDTQKKTLLPKNAAARTAMRNYAARIAAIDSEFEEMRTGFAASGKDVDTAVIALEKKIENVINFEAALQDNATLLDQPSLTYLRDFTQGSEVYQSFFPAAEKLRGTLTKLQESRAKVISKIAGEKRAAAAIEKGAGKTAAQRVAESQAEAARQRGLGLPGTRVERADLNLKIEQQKSIIDAARETLADMEAERQAMNKDPDVTSQEKSGMSKRITGQEKEIQSLLANLAKLKAQQKETKTAVVTEKGKPPKAEPMPVSKAEKKASAFLKANPEIEKVIKASLGEKEQKEAYLKLSEKTGEYVQKETKQRVKRAVVNVKSADIKTGQILGGAAKEKETMPPPGKVRTVLDKRKIARYEKTIPSPEEAARQAKARAGFLAELEDAGIDINEAPDTDAAFSIGEENATQVDAAEARALADKIKAGLPKDVRDKVLYVEKFDNIDDFKKVPGKLITAMGRMGLMSRDDDGVVRARRVKGAVLGDGTVVIFGSHHATLAELEATFAHELHGHYGIDMLLGKEGFKKLIKGVEKEHGSIMELAAKFGIENEVQDAAAYYAKLYQDMKKAGAPREKLDLAYDKGQIQAMRELIAHIEEARVDQNLLQKAGTFIKEMIGAVRAALRKMGFTSISEATTNDLYYLLRKSRNLFNQEQVGAYVSPTGDIVFSRKPAFSGQVDASIADTVSKVVKGPTSIADRIKSEATGIAARTAFVDRLAPMERVAEGLKKSAQAMQMLYYGRMYDQRMAWTGATVNSGAPTLKLDEKTGERTIMTRGGANLKDVADKLGQVKNMGNAEAVRDLFTTYLAAHRAENKGINKLNFTGAVSPSELRRVKNLGDSIPQFADARDLYNKYNNGLVSWLAESGAIDKRVADELLKDQDYVPFYRAIGDNVVMEVAGSQTITIGNLQNQPYLKDLVGGDQKIQDFFTSSLQNTAMIVDMGLRNLATKEAAFSLQEAGLLKPLGKYKGKETFIGDGHGPAQPNTLRFKMNGKDKFVVVESENAGIPSELLVQGLHGITTTIGGFTKVLAVPARFLRAMVTRNPVYSARQLVRDSTTNYLLAGGDMTPVASAAKEVMQMYAGTSKGEQELQKRGVIGGQLLTGTPEDMQKIMLQLSKGGSGWESALAKLDRMHMKADAAARVTLYNDYRKQGLSDMQATLATLESMNFSKRGTSGSLYALNMMVPFLNAQIQGLNVLYQAFTGKLPYADKLRVQRKLIARGLMMAAGTMAYAALMEDDDTYKNANLRDRLQNWFIPIPGVEEPLKVPIPFEIGLIFKALPEAVMLAASKDEDTERVVAALGGLVAMSSPVGVSTVVPQAAKPIVEAVTNYQFYNGAPVESMREQELLPSERTRDKTSGVAKLLSNMTSSVAEGLGYPTKGVSPVMFDSLINGYTGGLGLAIAQMIGSLVPVGETPPAAAKRMSDLPVVGSLFQPVDAAGQITQFYEKAKEYGQIKQSFDKMLEEGREDEARAFAEKYGRQIVLADVAGEFKQDMSEFTQLERAIRADQQMSPEEKRQRLDELRQAKIEFAKAFHAASRQQ